MPAPTDTAAHIAHVEWAGYLHRIEYQWLAPEKRDRPLLVFLHEGLGSIAIWKDFPQKLCQAANCRGLLFSRWGYGQSSPRAAHEHWQPDYLHQQAQQFLPAFFAAIGLDAAQDPPWIYGHSDGGSIALIYAASFADRVAGIAVAAPHIFVEDVALDGLAKIKKVYENTDLRDKLMRYHADPDSAFWGWNRAWLNPAFRNWNIQDLLPSIRCPVLAIQGYSDEYATMAQIDGIAAQVPGTRLLKLESGHTPHRDQPEQVAQAVADFIATARYASTAG